MLQALLDGPHTYEELAEVCGLHVQTIRRWLVPFRRPTTDGHDRLVRIAEWRPDKLGITRRPAFAWGSARDAKRTPLSNAERQRRVRQRRKMARLHFYGPQGRAAADQGIG